MFVQTSREAQLLAFRHPGKIWGCDLSCPMLGHGTEFAIQPGSDLVHESSIQNQHESQRNEDSNARHAAAAEEQEAAVLQQSVTQPVGRKLGGSLKEMKPEVSLRCPSCRPVENSISISWPHPSSPGVLIAFREAAGRTPNILVRKGLSALAGSASRF